MISTQYHPLSLVILHHLTGKEISRMETVCREWRDLICHDTIASKLIKRDFPKFTVLNDLPLHDQYKKLHGIIFNATNRRYSFHTINLENEPALPKTYSNSTHQVRPNPDGSLTITDLKTNQTCECVGHSNPTPVIPAFTINDVQFTPDGTRMVTASSDTTLKVWSLSNGELIHTLIGHFNAVIAVRITQKRNRAVSITEPGDLNFWNLETYRCQRSRVSPCSQVSTIEITPDQTRVIIVSKHDENVRIHSMINGNYLFTITLENVVLAIASHPFLPLIVFACNKSVCFFNPSTLQRRTVPLLTSDLTSINSIKFSADGTQLRYQMKNFNEEREAFELEPILRVVDFFRPGPQDIDRT